MRYFFEICTTRRDGITHIIRHEHISEWQAFNHLKDVLKDAFCFTNKDGEQQMEEPAHEKEDWLGYRVGDWRFNTAPWFNNDLGDKTRLTVSVYPDTARVEAGSFTVKF